MSSKAGIYLNTFGTEKGVKGLVVEVEVVDKDDDDDYDDDSEKNKD